MGCYGVGWFACFPKPTYSPSFSVVSQHSAELSKGYVIIQFSDWPRLQMQGRADRSRGRLQEPGGPRLRAAGNEWGRALPPLQGQRCAGAAHGPCLAAPGSGLERNAATIRELMFCYYLVLSLVCSRPVGTPGGTIGPAGREEKLSTQTAALEPLGWNWRITAEKELLV